MPAVLYCLTKANKCICEDELNMAKWKQPVDPARKYTTIYYRIISVFLNTQTFIVEERNFKSILNLRIRTSVSNIIISLFVLSV